MRLVSSPPHFGGFHLLDQPHYQMIFIMLVCLVLIFSLLKVHTVCWGPFCTGRIYCLDIVLLFRLHLQLLYFYWKHWLRIWNANVRAKCSTAEAQWSGLPPQICTKNTKHRNAQNQLQTSRRLVSFVCANVCTNPAHLSLKCAIEVTQCVQRVE